MVMMSSVVSEIPNLLLNTQIRKRGFWGREDKRTEDGNALHQIVFVVLTSSLVGVALFLVSGQAFVRPLRQTCESF